MTPPTLRLLSLGATDPDHAPDEEHEGCSPWSCHSGHPVPSGYEQAA